MLKETGERIVRLRKQSGMSQKEFADFLDVSISAVSQYENGKRCLKNDALVKVAKLFHTSVDYLLGLTDSAVIEDVDTLDNHYREMKEFVLEMDRLIHKYEYLLKNC